MFGRQEFFIQSFHVLLSEVISIQNCQEQQINACWYYAHLTKLVNQACRNQRGLTRDDSPDLWLVFPNVQWELLEN